MIPKGRLLFRTVPAYLKRPEECREVRGVWKLLIGKGPVALKPMRRHRLRHTLPTCAQDVA